MNATAPKPWYREPWPWILMAGPFLVVIASFVSFWFAASLMDKDGLVSDNYYKEGLAAGQTVARSEKAKELGLIASLTLGQDAVKVRLSAGADDQDHFDQPPAITLTLSHPTRAGLDQTLVLPWDGHYYSGQLRLPTAGHWLLLLEDEGKSWRLMGSVVLPASGELVIGGGGPADIRN
jgi:hypothetical protein